MIYLLSTSTLKERTTINGNVDDSLLKNAIEEAQDIYIQGALGTKLYTKICELVKLNSISNPENAKYKSLLDDHVSKALIYWSWLNTIPYVRFKIMNKSVSGQSSDNSTPVSTDELKELTQSIKDKAEFYTKRLVDHLAEHHRDYPEFDSPYKCDEMQPSARAYFCGIQFDRDSENYEKLGKANFDLL